MYWIGAPLRFLYKVYFGMIYFVSGIILYPYFMIAIRHKDKYKKAAKAKKVWSNVICYCCFIKVKLINEEHFPKEGPYIVCANHASYLDIILMFKVIPHDFAFLGKAEVLKWPIINVFFKNEIDIPVYRHQRKLAAESIHKTNEALRNNRSIAIFPEGKMQDQPPVMERFKNGAFSMAVEHNVPIVPITFKNNYKLFSDHTDFWGAGRPGIAKVFIHPIIKSENKTEIVSLRDKTFELINSEL